MYQSIDTKMLYVYIHIQHLISLPRSFTLLPTLCIFRELGQTMTLFEIDQILVLSLFPVLVLKDGVGF